MATTTTGGDPCPVVFFLLLFLSVHAIHFRVDDIVDDESCENQYLFREDR
eukprot:CAMPEP_0170780884 /NCGR_PEP_ID=MMETSP0733-20121128/13860_1 /TAXON_ID=186038 /ORGANISM="Fragilariopsis kerguelensis, Strain L26-C5" /LENGTH=49 /DNA_ID=CAMNT_0011124799 /DNA_START=510 /DNA_END=659 /DNA_ORIENTATION=+